MASSQITSASVPQGFSVYQPSLGAQLQFLPAVGTQELDDMINSFLPGPASIQEKRTAVSIDFLDYASATGQTFKFYPVYTLSASPLTQSPVTDSASSFNASPVASNWDFSRVSSQSSTTRQSRKSSPSSRPADFSHIPGMKIMTKEGVDVTNQASRGSKTKEQRDHAHLMRIIKACDACKRKKVRCDPSHKKRGAATPTPSQTSAATSSRVSKKTKISETRSNTVLAAAVATHTENLLPAPLPFEFDASFGLDSAIDSWEDLIQFPAEEVIDDDYNFFEDPHGYFSPVDFSLSPLGTTSTNSPATKHDENGELAVPRTDGTTALQFQAGTSPETALPYADQNGFVRDYMDFNLFSPQSDFSEDEHMVALKSSSGSLSTVSDSLSQGESSSSNTNQLDVRESPFGDVFSPTLRPELHVSHGSPEGLISGGTATQVQSAYYNDGRDPSPERGRGVTAPSPTSSVVSSTSSLPSLSSVTSSESSTSDVLLKSDKTSTGDAQITGLSISRRIAPAVGIMNSISSTTTTEGSMVRSCVPEELTDPACGTRTISPDAIMNMMATIAATVYHTALCLASAPDQIDQQRLQQVAMSQQNSVLPQPRLMVACA